MCDKYKKQHCNNFFVGNLYVGNQVKCAGISNKTKNETDLPLEKKIVTHARQSDTK